MRTHVTLVPSVIRANRMEPIRLSVFGEGHDHKVTVTRNAAGEFVASASPIDERMIRAELAEDEQPQARNSLAESLTAVVAQLLLRTADGKGRLAVHEILLRSSGLANLIREGNTAMLANAIQAGKKDGMQTMDDALFAAAQDGKVAADAAYDLAVDKKRFQAFLRPDER